MVLTPRNLIVAYSLVLACSTLIGSSYGQNYGQQASPYSTRTQDYAPSVIIDHSSMSPDSWSAPASTSMPVVSAPAPNSVFAGTAPEGRSVAPFQTTANNTFTPTRSQAASTPSIPDLKTTASRQSSNQVKSLIRQPPLRSASSSNAVGSPFQSTSFGMGGQSEFVPAAPDPRGLSNTSLPAFGKQSSLPQGNASATGKFDTRLEANRFVGNNSPTTSPVTSTPVTGSPAIGQPVTQYAPGRYPLGINGSLPTETPTIQVLPDASATTYQALTNGASSHPNYAVPSAATSQAMFQQQPPLAGLPTFRPDLGHRDSNPTFRGRDHDSGLKMDFEDKKKEFPGLGETLATGRYFGSVGIEYLEGAFQNNSAITEFNSTLDQATFVRSESFDFDFETAPRLRLGFESKLGPGVELDYFQYDQNSDVTSFTSNGLNSGQLSSGSFGPSRLTTLEAVNAGETLAATAGIDLETVSVSFFKEIKFPISRLNGMFGFQYASIFQTLEGRLTDAGGNVIGSLRSTSDLRAYGPKFRLEYYRPIGHTKLEFITKVGGGVLFGNRDQFISNTGAPAVNRFSSNELALTGDFYGGVQYKQNTAENRAYFVRLGITHQTWIGGGTAVDAQETFGLRGLAFEAGFNR